MTEKNIKSRIICKHDTEENWLKATAFAPYKGELIIYDIDDNYAYERFKIGDGKTVVSLLPFNNESFIKNLLNITDDTAYLDGGVITEGVDLNG